MHIHSIYSIFLGLYLLAIALALATLLYTKSTDELLWAKWLLAIPLLIVLPILAWTHHAASTGEGWIARLLLVFLSLAASPSHCWQGMITLEEERISDNDTIPFVTYIMAAYIIFLSRCMAETILYGHILICYLGPCSRPRPVESCSITL